MATLDTTTLDCGHPPTVTTGCGAGYATEPRTDRTMCYACANILEQLTIMTATPGDRHIGYINPDGTQWVTWCGATLDTDDTPATDGVLGQARRGARHNWSHERYYYTVVDAFGRTWAGTGAVGMWATLRLTTR